MKPFVKFIFYDLSDNQGDRYSLDFLEDQMGCSEAYLEACERAAEYAFHIRKADSNQEDFPKEVRVSLYRKETSANPLFSVNVRMNNLKWFEAVVGTEVNES